MAMHFPSFESITPQAKHDVFISFIDDEAHEGNGNNFANNLYEALCQKQVETARNKDPRREYVVSPSLKDVTRELQINNLSFVYSSNAIQESKISVIIFSRKYADFDHCLEELEHILECRKSAGQIVIPIFYEVHQSNVRDQTGTYQAAFAKHESRIDESVVKKWRDALKEASDLDPFSSTITRPQEQLEVIVNYILEKLNELSLSEGKCQVGVDSNINEIESLLRIGSTDVFTLGIWGISGTNKTTIVNDLFTRISPRFDCHCLIRNVRERLKNNGELIRMREEIFATILKDKDMNTGILNVGLGFARKRLRSKKILIVIDDVTSSSQIEFLLGGFGWMGSGSRIIVTSRDKQVLNNGTVDRIYEVKKLMDNEPLQLFCRYAFKENHPNVDLMYLSRKIVKYVGGVPMALKVLGSFLHNKEKLVWDGVLNKLEVTPLPTKVFLPIDVKNELTSRVDELNQEYKDIFLDIACFLKGKDADYVIEILDASDFSIDYLDKSFITVSNNMITMCDVLQDIGREAVQQESINNRSRLWHHADIGSVLTENTGTEAIKAISLDMSEIEEIRLESQAFAKMKLRFLNFYTSSGGNENKVQVFQDLKFDSSELSYFHWLGYPLKWLPSGFTPINLVAFDMPHSNLEQLWEDSKDLNLGKLKYINLTDSKYLRRFPNLSTAINLKRLILKGCTSLVEIEQRYIQNLNKLVILDLENCSRLKSLPSNICELTSLEQLILSGCSELKGLPKDLGNLKALKELKAKGIVKKEASPFIVRLSNLHFEIFKRGNLAGLTLPPLSGMSYLTDLDLTDCGIMELSVSLMGLLSLKSLSVGRNKFKSIPSIKNLPNLNYLDIRYCESLQSLPNLPRSLSTIEAQGCTLLQALPDLSSLFTFESKLAHAFNFTNCFKLDQNAFKVPMEEALRKLQYGIESLKGFEKISPTPSACICFPGDKIPEWFHLPEWIPLQPNYHEDGALITLKVQPNLNRKIKVVGFALCVVVALQDSDQEYNDFDWELYVRCECRLRHENGQEKIIYGHLWGWLNALGGARNFESHSRDHVFLGYNFFSSLHEFVQNGFGNEVSIRFCLEDECGEHVKCCLIKKCGVHLIYTLDQDEELPSK